MRREYLLLVAIVAVAAWVHNAQAAELQQRSDTISSSRPASISDHTIRFTTSTAVPVSGKIVITPETGDFTIPAAMDYTDIDLLISAVQQTLAASPGSGGGSAVGVSVISGTSGSITFTLNDTDSISAGSAIIIRVGTNAVFGATGDQQMVNPSSVDSYQMDFETRDASSTELDSGGTIIAIVDAVGLNVGPTPTPSPSPSPSPTPGGQIGGPSTPAPTPAPTITSITLWMTTIADLTVQEFSVLTTQELSAVLGLTVQDLYAVLSAQYPQLFELTVQEFSALIAQELADVLGLAVDELYDVLNVADLRQLDSEPANAPETTLTATVTDGAGTVQLGVGGDPISFTTENMGGLNIAIIEGGDWIFSTYAFAQSADTSGQTTLSVQISVLDASGQESLLFEHQITDDLAFTSTEYITTTTQPSFILESTDRIVMRYYTTTTGSLEPVTVTLFYQGEDRYSGAMSPPIELISPTCSRIADFVSGPGERPDECRVNIYDLSIMMYNWPTLRNNPDTDLNSDGNVYIIDFSILLYWWTG